MRGKRIAQNSFAALSDESRLKIFLKIVELASSASITDNPIVAQNTAKHLGEIFGLAKSTLSHHIDALKMAELVFEIRQKKFVYLYPNFAKLIEFKNFIDEKLMVYMDNDYSIIANLDISQIPNFTAANFKDFLIITGFKNVTQTTDQAGSQKIYFKITGFVEPFYATIKASEVKIYSQQKNFDSALPFIEKLSSLLAKCRF